MEIDYDAFDLGIQVGEDWWFLNDKGHHPIFGDFVLKYSESDMKWIADGGGLNKTYIFSEFLTDSKCIGNIHEGETP
jgi:hypothetical protein